uniref:Uncharacterized protein n=1 Tax=Rhizophagus irregularis (strain DAOM 181602 / DAOM 197198 / MUCL 43194) TaxID=747089 RepID=U9UHE1_RHIID
MLHLHPKLIAKLINMGFSSVIVVVNIIRKIVAIISMKGMIEILARDPPLHPCFRLFEKRHHKYLTLGCLELLYARVLNPSAVTRNVARGMRDTKIVDIAYTFMRLLSSVHTMDLFVPKIIPFDDQSSFSLANMIRLKYIVLLKFTYMVYP